MENLNPRNSIIINSLVDTEKSMVLKENQLDPTKDFTKAFLIKRKFIEWSETSTSHGYPNIFRTNRTPVKIYWLIMLLISVGFCSYLVVKGFIDYFSNTTTTSITIYYENPIDMPMISVCNSNPFLTETGEEFFYKSFAMFDSKTYEEVYIKYVNNSRFARLKNLVSFDKYFYYIKALAASKSINDTYKKSFGLESSEFFVELRTNNKLAEIYSLDDYLVWFYDMNYGNCFKINSGKMLNGTKIDYLQQSKRGTDQGLFMILFLDFFKNHEDNFMTIDYSHGPRISISNQDYIPLLKYEYISLSTGKCTYLKLKKVITKREPDPYSDCVKVTSSNSKYYQEFESVGKKYQQSVCLEMCYQDLLIKKCNCSNPEIVQLSYSTPCEDTNGIQCIYMHSSSQNISKCLPFCPLECESVTYEVSSSLDTFPHPGYSTESLKYTGNFADYLQKHDISAENITYEEISNSLTCVYIYFDDFIYNEITESPSMTIVDFLSNIGG